MIKKEPKIASSIVTRPAHTSSGKIYKTSSVHWISELYVKNKKIYTSTDYDCEDAAFVGVAKHIQWYQNKFKSNIFIDASMDKLHKNIIKESETVLSDIRECKSLSGKERCNCENPIPSPPSALRVKNKTPLGCGRCCRPLKDRFQPPYVV